MHIEIDYILQKQNRTRYWLAKQIGTSQNNMSKICNGETTRIGFDILENICKTLNCTPNDILKMD